MAQTLRTTRGILCTMLMILTTMVCPGCGDRPDPGQRDQRSAEGPADGAGRASDEDRQDPEQPDGEQPDGEQPEGEQPDGEQPGTEGPEEADPEEQSAEGASENEAEPDRPRTSKPKLANNVLRPYTYTLANVEIEGETFALEIADTPEKQHRGLSHRASIDKQGGMIFVLKPQRASFVMRDCLVDIDIVFLNEQGVVLAAHEMKTEPARRRGESSSAYNARLKRYSSGGITSHVLEFASGTIDRLGLEKGDRIDLPASVLKITPR